MIYACQDYDYDRSHGGDAQESVGVSRFQQSRNRFRPPDYVSGKIARELFSARTSADGKFRIGNFPADTQAGLSVKKVGKARRQTGNSFRYDQLPYHAGQEDITLTLDPAGSVIGKVVVRGPASHSRTRWSALNR